MTLEACLAAFHLLAILTLVVFLSSEAALCRAEWMNAAVVRRLSKLDLIYGIAAGVLLLSGIARVVWGGAVVDQTFSGFSPLAQSAGCAWQPAC